MTEHGGCGPYSNREAIRNRSHEAYHQYYHIPLNHIYVYVYVYP